jgi:hypothetical protein
MLELPAGSAFPVTFPTKRFADLVKEIRLVTKRSGFIGLAREFCSPQAKILLVF